MSLEQDNNSNDSDHRILGKKVIVVMPAYNAEKTIEQTYNDLPHQHIYEVFLVDDASFDNTVKVSKSLNLKTIVHHMNMGYGGNQKTCYREALLHDADVVVMLHPDYQYSPKLITAMAAMVASEEYDVVLGSRMLTGGALKGGMPLYKYIANHFLTFFQNRMMNMHLSEYHTGFRAFSARAIKAMPLHNNIDDFIFDNQMLAQCVYNNFRIGEISCPTRYFEEASSISFARSVKYGFGVLLVSLQYRLQKWGLAKFSIFADEPFDYKVEPEHITRVHQNSE